MYKIHKYNEKDADGLYLKCKGCRHFWLRDIDCNGEDENCPFEDIDPYEGTIQRDD